ncbi:MAG TPA: hypothetical protein QGF02_02265 [Candidatus Babeliales bacterium]|nr:hypothetical protein [Candidatus Babeliales bacterium]
MKKLLVLFLGTLTISNSFGFSKESVANSVRQSYSKLANSSIILGAQAKASQFITTVKDKSPVIADKAAVQARAGYDILVKAIEEHPNAALNATVLTACAALIVYGIYKAEDPSHASDEEEDGFYYSDERLFY